MSYLQTVAEIRTAANAVNGNRFDHGRIVDFSQNFDKKFPYIWLYPFTSTDATSPDDNFDSHTLTVGFWQQDKPDTSVQEREAIIGEMDALCTAFMTYLTTNNKVLVTAVNREPQYQMHQGHVSGYAVRFTYQNLVPC